MAVRVENKVFYLETKNSLYQMKADEHGVLRHLWYGPKTEQDMDYLLDYPDVGFAGNIYEADTCRTYSLNTLPLEYGTAGVGDYRVPAVAIVHEDGSNALDLRCKAYRITEGKYSIPGLPAVYAEEQEADTLEIVLKDTATEIYVILQYGILEEYDIITRNVIIENRGEQAVTLQRVHSLCLDFPYGDWEWIHFHGRHAMERQFERREVFHGIQESGSIRGMSSHQQNPAVLLCEKDCTETSGFCIGAALMYSGGFQAQIEKDQLNQTRVVMGIHPDTFSWKLEGKDCFYAPEVILSCSNEGMGALSRQFHRIIREHVCRGKYKLEERPVLINNWEATYFDFDDKKLLNIVKEAARLGVDMMVMDDGWFGKRDDDYSGLGDWYVNEKKIKGGLAKLVEQVNDLGMKFGIWFEPEMISEDSDLYRAHPDWAIQIPGRKPMRGRSRLLLDMTRKEVRDYLYQVISAVLDSANVEYVKWDMNRSISDWYSAELTPDRQGEMPHRYVLGLYELLERLTHDYPNVLFEGGSGGGGRFDAGMLYYCPQIWCSDDTDAYERTKIQYGTSFFYPVSTVGSHVSAVPNHQTGRVTPFGTRAITAMAGSFGYELDLNTLSEEEKKEVTAQIKRFKEYGPLIHNGAYYRLSNPMEDKFAVWEFVSPDQSQALVHGMIFRTEANMLRYPVRLQGLAAGKRYRLEDTEQEYTGAALMEAGILLPRSRGDYAPVELVFAEVSD